MALFNRAFGLSRSLEHWRWQFEQNPYAPPTIIVALRDGDDELVGSHVLMPVALNAQGTRVLAGHTLDLVVHEDFRNRGIFRETAQECFAWGMERGIRAVFAFPNSQSYPGFVRSLGWSRILELRRWDVRLGVRGALGRAGVGRTLTWLPDLAWRSMARARIGSAARWTVEHSDRVPDDHDTLWAECSREMRVSLWKDREYLEWRYDRNPDHSFEYVALRETGRLRALAVLWRDAGRAMWCEWICPRASGPAPGLALADAVQRHAIRLGDDRLSFLGHDDGFFARCLTGYKTRPAPESVLTGRALEPGPLDDQIRDGAHWTVTFGDADYV